MTPSALANLLVIDFVNRKLITLPGGRGDHFCRENSELDKMFGRVVCLDVKQELKFPDDLDPAGEE